MKPRYGHFVFEAPQEACTEGGQSDGASITAPPTRSEGLIHQGFTPGPGLNNAGADPSFKVGQPVDLPEMDRAIFLNLNAPIHLTCGLLEGMRARNQGTIVNVTSGLAIAPSADTPVYCATKVGLRSFTMALRAQLANSNIVVIEALPPMVDTAMTSAIANPAKITATSCADAIIQGIVDGKTVINIGQVKVLSRIYSVSPALARRIMLRS